jgi:hypothetical protein
MLGQRAEAGKLRKDDRHAAADRRARAVLGALAQVESLPAARGRPRGDVRALKVDFRPCAVGGDKVEFGQATVAWSNVVHGIASA